MTLIDAAPVRAHILRLSRSGVGIRSVVGAANVRWRLVAHVRTGKQLRISRENARRILAVGKESRLMRSARRTKDAIAEMERLGLTRADIARRLGYSGNHVYPRYRRYVFEYTEARVLRLLREVRAEVARARELAQVCADCGLDHAPAARHVRLRRFNVPHFADAHEAFPCVYPETAAGVRLFERDRAATRSRETP